MISEDVFFMELCYTVLFCKNQDIFFRQAHNNLSVALTVTLFYKKCQARFRFCVASIRLEIIDALAASIPKNIQAVSVACVFAFTLSGT